MCSKIYISRKTKTANLYIQKISRWRDRVHCIIKPKRLIISSSSSDPFERASALLACSANSWDIHVRTAGRIEHQQPLMAIGMGAESEDGRQGPSTMPWPRPRHSTGRGVRFRSPIRHRVKKAMASNCPLPLVISVLRSNTRHHSKIHEQAAAKSSSIPSYAEACTVPPILRGAGHEWSLNYQATSRRFFCSEFNCAAS